MKPKGLSAFLRAKRQGTDVTQLALAQHLGHTSPQYISNYERELCEPSLETAVKIARKLGIPRTELKAKILSLYEAYVSQVIR